MLSRPRFVLRVLTVTLVSAACLSLAACPDDPQTATADTSEDASPDAPGDATDDQGTQDADAQDVAPDVPPMPGYENVPPATPTLQAGAAFRSFRFPIGIPTVGFGPGTGGDYISTRFNEVYSGTNAQHTDVGAKAVVMRRNGKAFALVRLDLIGVWDTNRDELGVMLRERGRGDLADGLILAATHTHASGGRLMDHPIVQIALDTYMPGMFERLANAILDAVIAADAAAVEAEFGYTTIQVPELHSDRRCENGPVQDSSMGLVKVVAADDGRDLAIIVSYAMHGTVLGGDQNTLSGDAPAAVEFGIEHALPQPAPVLFLQSWAGDMAPVSPNEYSTQQGFDLRSDFVDLSQIAAASADLIVPALAGIETTATPDIDVETIRFPMDPLEINPDGSYDDYPYGAIYCMPASDNCPEDGGVPYESLTCFPFEEDQTITSSQISAARIGDLGFVTLPGEPLTSLGVELRDRAIQVTGLSQFFVIGYSQGYLGYLLHPDDYWMGGYEGNGSLMGPNGGQFLVDTGVAIAERMTNPDSVLPFEPVPPATTVPPLQPLEIEEALGQAGFSAQPQILTGVVEAAWNGGDPAADHPTVTLEKDQGDGTFAPVLRPNGAPFTNYGPEMEIYLAVDPSYGALALGPRTFTWTVKLPTRFSVPLQGGPLVGSYRFVVEGTRPDDYRITSEAFEIPADVTQ